MPSEERWKKAQEHEKSFWQAASGAFQKGESDQLSWYKWRADHLENLLKKAFPHNPPDFSSSRILEIGSGPVGVVSFFNAAERIAIDPLCDYYSSQDSLIKHRNKDVSYHKGRGEELLFDDNSFELVIIENVIDHVQNPGKVIDEIRRVLKPRGILYLTVNLHPLWGAFLHTIISNLRIDKGHPHTFTVRKIRNFLTSKGFDILFNDWENYRECQKNDISSDSFKDKAKGLLGLSEFLYTSISVKNKKI